MHPQPSESPELFRKQIRTLFEDASLEVNHFLFWAETAQGRARGMSAEQAVAWYTNAMLIYDFLEQREQRAFLSRIYMRLSIISIYGYHNHQSKPYLDEIMAWMAQSLPGDAEPVRAEASQWRQLPVERIGELRLLKLKLKVAEQLQEQGLTLHEDVHSLIPLIALLP